MTKAALRRQEQERERQAREAPELNTRESTPTTSTEAITQQPQVPHMEPPPPYDAPHLPRTNRNQITNSGGRKPHDDPGCMNSGRGEVRGCMNYNSGANGDDFVVEGCMNYDSAEGCMNYNSTGGCMNYESQDGCMNYRSHEGCMNYEVETNGGCMNYRSNRGGCMNFWGSR